MPEGVEDIVIGDGVVEYKKLRDFERRLDAVMMRKMIELNDKEAHSSDRRRKLRIWISNSVENQPWQGGSTLDEGAFDFNTGADARYRVKIVGKLLDDEDPDEADSDEEGGATSGKIDNDAMDHDAQGAEGERPKADYPSDGKLSQFFKAISVEFDRSRNLQPDGANVIEWKKPQSSSRLPNPPPAADFDTLEFERKSDENLNCTINFYRDEDPERYALSKELAAVLDTDEATRDTIISGIWEYSKAMDLQQDEEKRTINCDDKLRAVSVTLGQSLPHF